MPLNFELQSKSFKEITPRSGGYQPGLELITTAGTKIEFVDYAGGKSIYVTRPNEAKSTRVFHWGVDGPDGYGAPKYSLDWFRKFAEAGEDVTELANKFCEAVCKIVAEEFNSEAGIAFLATIVEKNATAPAPAQPKTGFQQILGTMSNFRACAKKATDADSFQRVYAESQAARAQQASGANLDTAKLAF